MDTMPAYWEYSFRADGGRDRPGSRREPGRGRQAPASLADTDTAHDPCERGDQCSGRKRSLEVPGWIPAPAAQHVCTACQAVLSQCLAELPAVYGRLAGMATDPVRSASGVRVPPGSRVLANVAADALMREIADVTGGWAARIRALPQLQLAHHGYPHGSADQVTADCRVIGREGDLSPLLALPDAPVFRTWHYLPGASSTRTPAVPCRRCGIPVSPSPSGKRWWPAVCAHPSAAVASYAEDRDGNPVPSAWACAACSKRLPKGWEAAPHCDHEPSRNVQSPAAKATTPRGPRTRADVEEEIGDLEVVRAGDGWVTAVTRLHGGQGACELTEVRIRATRLLRENPAPPELLDGIPCRECGAWGLERAPLPAGPEREGEEVPFSRCLEPACRATMTRQEYHAWTGMYAAWTKGSGILVCARCEAGNCRICCWPDCTCKAVPGHAAAQHAPRL
jgi:hypothetical protein